MTHLFGTRIEPFWYNDERGTCTRMVLSVNGRDYMAAVINDNPTSVDVSFARTHLIRQARTRLAKFPEELHA